MKIEKMIKSEDPSPKVPIRQNKDTLYFSITNELDTKTYSLVDPGQVCRQKSNVKREIFDEIWLVWRKGTLHALWNRT